MYAATQTDAYQAHSRANRVRQPKCPKAPIPPRKKTAEHDREQGKKTTKTGTTLVKVTGRVGKLPTAGRQEFAARGLRRCFAHNAARGRCYPIHRKNETISRLDVVRVAVCGPHPREAYKTQTEQWFPKEQQFITSGFGSMRGLRGF